MLPLLFDSCLRRVAHHTLQAVTRYHAYDVVACRVESRAAQRMPLRLSLIMVYALRVCSRSITSAIAGYADTACHTYYLPESRCRHGATP